LRSAPAPSPRPLENGPNFFVDAQRGDDANDGSEKSPWKTVRRGLAGLRPGSTLVLRGGTYYEPVAVRLLGRPGAPITLRSYPGEQAVLDAGFREFFETPVDAWQPHPGGGTGEFRSVRAFPNLRHVIGSFGDSMIGLQTYYHAIDLRADNELWGLPPGKKDGDVMPVYCGPGIWYDPESGHIHARLAHTNLADTDNYKGETDPRKLPLVLAAFRAVPLHVDGAEHIRFQDLVIRGAGYDAVVLDQCSNIEFDNVTIWCGTYGLRATGVQRLKLHRCGLYGNAAPWTFRNDTSLRNRPGRGLRDITRLNTHANLIAECGREFSVYAFPLNDDWEISYCEFTDAHDGPYLGGVSMRFHHNLVENMHDDGIYLSPMYPRHYYMGGGARIEVFCNSFSRCLTTLAFGGTDDTKDTIWIYRNVFDLRGQVHAGRPTTQSPKPSYYSGKLMGDHGSPPWPTMNFYHNTCVTLTPDRDAAMGANGHLTTGNLRQSFNNAFVHLAGLPGYDGPNPASGGVADGNLYWSPKGKVPAADAFFAGFRGSPGFAENKKLYAPGSTTNSRVGDPKFLKVSDDPRQASDYRLQPGSAAIDSGVAIPAEWPDPLRALDKGKADIGALPLGAPPLKVGRAAGS
jgi:hypothetical protein